MKFNFSTLLSVAALLAGVNAKLSDSEKSKLLQLHKEARSRVGASNMKSIQWNEKLAAEAEAYATKCSVTVHSSRSSRLSESNGENLSWGGGSISELFSLWTDERKDLLNAGYVKKFGGALIGKVQVGHYSQVVWAKNDQVGCGAHSCGSATQLVCRYGTGNNIGEPVYVGGEGYSDSKSEKDKEPKHEEKKPEPKPTTRKTTTTTTTTTTTIKRTTTTTTKAPVTTKVAQATKNVVSTKVPAATKVPGSVTTSKVPAVTPAVKQVNPFVVPATKQAENPVTKQVENPVTKQVEKSATKKVNEKTEKKDNETNNKEIEGSEKSENKDEGGNGIVTGVAISGSVVGAAAAFAFVKKNPKKYEDIKRSISRGTTTIKRGATSITRRVTSKKTTPPVNANMNDYTYRADLSNILTA
ncbi:PR-1-like protein [Piromyces finnis]|uniref:PR-1-like protein n=1 Tax=Piromyces finnis TaxID=1754191 RepID=A0A1Y1VEZ0_9FUNG|nr:PR-1-like protein [Piromyces finnis]|eukprot:ORX54647.1 PR-1-like protein [Piromyces finnis]